jgi:hypothetical protein
MRSSWVYDKELGKLVPKDEFYQNIQTSGIMVIPDLPSFVSPIDRKIYSGRAGMREHCKIHDVVPTSELKGLPTKPAVMEHKYDPALKQTLINEFHRRDSNGNRR